MTASADENRFWRWTFGARVAGYRHGMEVDQAAPQVHAVDLAQGMLMERFQVSSPVASDMLRAHARACRLPVVEVARWLVATRYLL